MSQNRRMSQSFTASPADNLSASSSSASAILPSETETWVENWKGVYAKDIIDSRIVVLQADVSVEEACEKLLSENIPCLAVQDSPECHNLAGLFDFSDVNAFLTLAATKHTFSPEDLRDKPRVEDIFVAAKAGHVPVRLVSNLSEKNPLEILPHDATVTSLLERFARGVHRVLIRSPPPSHDFAGIVSDRQLLSWFTSYAKKTPSLQTFLSNSLRSFGFPSLYLYSAVVAATSKSTVLEAMRLMSDEGVSSVAVLDDDSGSLLSAVSVTDIGKIVVPSESNQIISIPLHQFITYIKAPEGSTDGAEKFPVYSVSPNNTLFHTMEMLLATNSHRVFITAETPESSSPMISSFSSVNLSGIVSIVDILSLFARLANVQDIDPTRMQRHRRASSVSSQSSRSDRAEFNRSRSSSRTGVSRTSSLSHAARPRKGRTNSTRDSISSAESIPHGASTISMDTTSTS